MKIWEYLLPVVYSTGYCEGTSITNKKLFLTLNIIFIALLRVKEIREISRGNPQPQTYIGTVQILSWTQSCEQQTLQLKKKKSHCLYQYESCICSSFIKQRPLEGSENRLKSYCLLAESRQIILKGKHP